MLCHEFDRRAQDLQDLQSHEPMAGRKNWSRVCKTREHELNMGNYRKSTTQTVYSMCQGLTNANRSPTVGGFRFVTGGTPIEKSSKNDVRIFQELNLVGGFNPSEKYESQLG